MAETLRDRLQWQTSHGQIMDADRRYLLMRTDVLMGVFRELPPEARQQAFAALARSANQGGGASTRAYFQSLQGDVSALLNTMTAYSAELGWGVWFFSRDAQAHKIHLKVHNSPFAAGFGASDRPVCHPIAGILQTVGELALGQSALVQETCCAAQGHTHCEFHIQALPAPDSQ